MCTVLQLFLQGEWKVSLCRTPRWIHCDAVGLLCLSQKMVALLQRRVGGSFRYSLPWSRKQLQDWPPLERAILLLSWRFETTQRRQKMKVLEAVLGFLDLGWNSSDPLFLFLLSSSMGLQAYGCLVRCLSQPAQGPFFQAAFSCHVCGGLLVSHSQRYFS